MRCSKYGAVVVASLGSVASASAVARFHAEKAAV
jgi:hypothetical protein